MVPMVPEVPEPGQKVSGEAPFAFGPGPIKVSGEAPRKAETAKNIERAKDSTDGRTEFEEPTTFVETHGTEEEWKTLPIYRLPSAPYLSWPAPRAGAKVVAKALALYFGTRQENGVDAMRDGTIERGPPCVKPGRSRRHGGYGIG